MRCVEGGWAESCFKDIANAARPQRESKLLLKAEPKSPVRREEVEAEGGRTQGEG